jgi:hypothetical protein
VFGGGVGVELLELTNFGYLEMLVIILDLVIIIIMTRE